MNRLLEMILTRGVFSPEGGSDGGTGGDTDPNAGAGAGTGGEESGGTQDTPPAGEQAPGEGAEAGQAGDAPKTGEEPPAGEGGEQAGDQPPAPLTNENVHIPEGFAASEEVVSDLIGVLNDNESTPQQRLDNLVGLGQKLVQEAEARRAQEWIDSQKAEAEEIKNSPEFGGDKFDASQAVIATVLQEFGSPELNELIVSRGMGNSIVFYRFLHSIGKVMAEGKPVVGASTSAEKPPLAERMYPNQGKS